MYLLSAEWPIVKWLSSKLILLSEVNVGGVKYKVLGDSADDFKFKIRSKKK